MSFVEGRRATSGAQRFVLAALAFVAVTAFAHRGEACSCGGDWQRSDSDVIFRGKVVEVHRPLHLRFVPRRADRLGFVAWRIWYSLAKHFDADVRTVFQVDTAWRGSPSLFMTVNTGSGMCCNCSLGDVFVPGGEYIVYAMRETDGELSVAFGSGHAFLGKALPLEDIGELGPGIAPTRGGRGVPLVWRHLILPAALLGFVGLAVLGAQWRRRLSPNH